jgi:hypothetical protein
MGMKINSSVKVAAAALGTLGLAYAGYTGYHRVRVSGFELKEIAPARVNLVAISPEAGYRIIVSNRLAQLAEVSGDSFGRGGSDDEAATNASRLPIREYLAALQGDEKALGLLVEKLNDLSEDDLPPVQIEWPAAELEMALSGDPAMEKKLTADLNVTLDGRPLSTFNSRAVFNGIVVLQEVPVKMRVAGKETTLIAEVRRPYQPSFSRSLEKSLAEDNRFRGSVEEVAAKYRGVAQPLLDGTTQGEDVRRALRELISERSAEAFAVRPENVLKSAVVLLADQLITRASSTTSTGPNGRTLTDITLGLTEEGKMRLWKYSVDNKGFQLLFIVDDIAISAPRISTELNGDTVKITQVPDQKMAEGAVQTINELNRS